MDEIKNFDHFYHQKLQPYMAQDMMQAIVNFKKQIDRNISLYFVAVVC